jgi:hypothetical protein
MPEPSRTGLQERVVQAAETILQRSGSVGPLELFQEMGWLPSSHVDGWRKGNEYLRVLAKSIHAGAGKVEKAIFHFHEWVRQHGLQPIEATYTRRGPRGIEPLQITADGNPEREKFYRTHYAPADLSGKKTARLTEKLTKVPDLVVFEKVSEEGKCSECGAELGQGDFLFMEKGQPLCLVCADLDHLLFLPAGNTALSRRARKHSSLSAVVVRFSRNRKRYERQGLLVATEALDKAEAECAADAPKRAVARQQAAVRRVEKDQEFVTTMTGAILRQYPACPTDEARRIAAHTARRGSGRVGRSAAGRELDPQAIKLAVIAHIRHEHTNYDHLLMQGAERLDARILVREKINEMLVKWRDV